MIDLRRNHILSIKIFYVLALFFFVACGKDDVCTQNPVTPQMNMVFFSDETNEQAPVDTLKVIRFSEGVFIRVDGDSIDVNSILAPLSVTADASTFIFKYSNNQTDTIALTYERSNVFVNKACGFKTVFSNVAIENHTTNKIIRIEVNEQTIESKDARHLLIYF